MPGAVEEAVGAVDLRRVDGSDTGPHRSVPHGVALVGLVYATLGGAAWLSSALTFAYADAGTRVAALVLLPWSALPLLLVLRGSSPRPVGSLVLAAALAQFAIARGSWGLELAYLPLALVGVVLLLLGRTGQARPSC